MSKQYNSSKFKITTMKKLIFSLLILLSFSSIPSQAQSDSVAKSFDIAPGIMEKLDGDQLLELVKEKERLKQEHETAMAEKFGVSGPELLNEIMPSEFIVVLAFIIFFSFLIMLVIIPFYFNQRKAKLRSDLFAKLIDSNKDIPKELLLPDKKPRTDLHKSIILICIGISVGLFLFLLKLENNYWTIGLIPTIIGVGYFLSYKFGNKNEAIEQL
jgi:Domain of unknown function (DUF6249)